MNTNKDKINIAIVALLPIFTIFLFLVEKAAKDAATITYDVTSYRYVLVAVYVFLGISFSGIISASRQIQRPKITACISAIWIVLLLLNNFKYLFTLYTLQLDVYLVCFTLTGVYLFVFIQSGYQIYKENAVNKLR